MGNSQSQGQYSPSNGGRANKSASVAVDSSEGTPISKEEMESRFSELVVRLVYEYGYHQCTLIKLMY